MSIPTALFKRHRCREPGASARYAVRRAGGGTSLMARRSSGKAGAARFLLQRRSLAASSAPMARRSSGRGQILPRRRPLSARREDRISALPDDLLLLILRRLDTRTALGAGSLSSRWAHLPRELGALDLMVGDMLPPRYHRCARLYRDACSKWTFRHAVSRDLLPNIRRYERRAMRAFTSSVESFLEGPQRKVKRLGLEFVVTGNAGCINRLIAQAIDYYEYAGLKFTSMNILNLEFQTITRIL